MSLNIAGRIVGLGHPALIVAEVGINHNGNVETALAMVRAAAAAGADAVKIQAYSAEHMTTAAAMYQGERQIDLFQRYELQEQDFAAIAAECRRVGVEFFGTPDCEAHADMLLRLGAPCLKAGSDDLTNLPLLGVLARKGVPLILSTGMGSDGEIVQAVRAARPIHMPGTIGESVGLLHCVSLYPTPAADANLRQFLRWPFVTEHGPDDGLVLGYSDHTDGPDAAPLAVALGACIVEKHFTLDRSLPGPDHAFSADHSVFAEMVRRVRLAETLLGPGRPDREEQRSDEELAMRPIARRSIVAALDMPAGTRLTMAHLAFKRPGTGLSPARTDVVMGKTLVRDVAADAILSADMVE